MEPTEPTPIQAESQPRSHRADSTGAILGIATFLAGIVLLAWTFSVALGMFNVPPTQALGLKQGQPLDVNATGQSLLAIVFRIVMLFAMSLIGGIIASRGIRLYGESRAK